MKYWSNMFAGETWDEFLKNGAKVSGFRKTMGKRAEGVSPGDVFLCYVTGVKRWVGLLEVKSKCYHDSKRIYTAEDFPVRFAVKALGRPLSLEHGVPMEQVAGRVSFRVMRESLMPRNEEDGETISQAIRDTEAAPLARPVNPKLLKMRRRGDHSR